MAEKLTPSYFESSLRRSTRSPTPTPAAGRPAGRHDFDRKSDIAVKEVSCAKVLKVPVALVDHSGSNARLTYENLASGKWDLYPEVWLSEEGGHTWQPRSSCVGTARSCRGMCVCALWRKVRDCGFEAGTHGCPSSPLSTDRRCLPRPEFPRRGT